MNLISSNFNNLTSSDLTLNYIYYNKNVSMIFACKRKKDMQLFHKLVKPNNISFELRRVIFFSYCLSFLLKYVSYFTNYIIFLNTIFLYGNLPHYFFNNYFSFMSEQIQGFNTGWLGFLILLGLGFKVFFYKSFLFFRLGFCRIATADVPVNINFVLRRKDRVFFAASNKATLGNFLAYLKHFKMFNIYKSKGFFNLFDFSIIPLKKGKQQQLF